MFIDEVIINVKAGKGGNGCVSFRRERFVPKGGPDGGDGGKGGNIYIQADSQIKTLIEYYRKPHHKAENGENGSSHKKNGKNGNDLFLKVPVGTILENVGDGNIIADLSQSEEKICIACGGIGGKGNYRFRNSIRRSPKFAQRGEPGEEKTIKLNLKLVADAALIGFPNVGKSTLLSKMSAAKPKIADYPFTTLEPHLGVVSVNEGNQFILSDTPGLIEGASRGAGLGVRFLKHIERTKVIVHVIDGTRLSVNNIMADYLAIRSELNHFSSVLQGKEELLVVNKCDLPEVKKKIEKIKKAFSKEGKNIISVSAITGEGLSELIFQILQTIKLAERKEITSVLTSGDKTTYHHYEPPFVIRKEEEKFVIEGERLVRLVRQFDLDNPQALKYFQEKIKSLGVEKALRKKGIQEGDIVRIDDKEFYFFSR